MTLRQQMQGALASMFDPTRCGVAAVWNGAGVNLLIDSGPERTERHDTTRAEARFATVRVLRADVDQPDYRDRVSWDGMDWRVVRILSQDWLATEIELEIDRRPVL